MRLNAAQQAAVDLDGHVLVVAGPGSGKTRLQITKAGKLLKDPHNKVVAVTFTRAAAAELRERALIEIGDPAVIKNRFLAGTFHSLSLGLFKKHGQTPRIISEAVMADFAKRAAQVSESGIDPETAVKIIQRAKAVLDYMPMSGGEERLLVAYQQILDRNRVMDMQDIVLQALRAMQARDIPPIGCTHMLVDEYQDADEIQLEWVLCHAMRGTLVTGVCDDDQTIYTFRHSLGYEGVTRFRDAVKAETIVLNENYRCRAEILAPAVALVKENRDRLAKNLHAVRGDGGKVQTHFYASRDQEASAICEAVAEAPDEWAILARTNHLLDGIESALSSARIPYSRVEGGSIWTRRPVAVLLSVLDGLRDGHLLGMDRALGYAGVEEADIQKMHKHLRSPGDVDGLDVSPVAKQTAKELIGLHERWHGLKARPNLCIAAVASWVEKHTPSRQANIIEVATNALCKMQGSIQQRLNAVHRMGRADGRESGVFLGTMHGSKGLEFDRVWLAGCEHDVAPLALSPIEDERRLFYVAMTRAKDELHLSCGGIRGEFISQVKSYLEQVVGGIR